VCQKKYNRCQASYPHTLSSPQFYDFLAVRALFDALRRHLCTWVGEGALFGPHTRLVGAPNYAPSLRSVAGLLLALVCSGPTRTPSPPRTESQLRAPSTCAFLDQLGNCGDGARRVVTSHRDWYLLPGTDGRRGAPRAQAREQLAVNGLCQRMASISGNDAAPIEAPLRTSWEGGRGVFAGAFQSEREEETRD
jgi:hypothetical protein